MSSSWDFGGQNSRLNGSSDSGMIDLKALLNQVTGGGLGGLTAPLGGHGSGISGGRNGGLGGGQRIGSNGGFASNPAGVIGGGIGSGGMEGLSIGGSSTNNGFFDPFASMSTFGFFNPKDPGSNTHQPMDNRNNSSNMGDRNMGMGDRNSSMDRNMSMGDRNMSMGDRNMSMGDRNMGMGDRNMSMGDRNMSIGDRNGSMGDRNGSMGDRNGSMGDRNMGMGDRNSSMGDRNNMGMGGDRNTGMGMSGGYGMGHSKSPPTYGHGQRMTSSPIFGGNHSPINFFGGGGSSSSGHQQNQFSSSSNYGGGGNGGNSQNSKFSIGTFSIDDTIPGRERTERESNSSMFGSSDNNGMSSNNHNQYGGSGSEKNMFGSTYRDRDSYGNSSNNSGGGGNSSNNHGSGTTNRTNEHGDNAFNQGVRETGIIEKLLHSYGFIQCCERQARLFFHFSQFDGTIEHLKLGDPVEFEMTYDRRTGKPIASAVTKIGPEVVLSEERVSGTVTTELHQESSGELQVSSQAQVKGRISYENRGECFFLPYCQEDIEGSVTLSVGDTVSFQIATNQRSGNLTARYVRLENPARPVRYKGIVSSLKDNFGFIERADVAKEIFFHFSETRIIEAITVSDNVEFNIQTRSGKEVACAITKLPVGTVVFEDIGTDTLKGQILKPIDKTQCPSPTIGPTPRSESSEGRLRYRGPDRQELEVVFGEKDMKGSFTMRHGDWVQFQLAVDRRNKQQRATNVTLLEESFSVSGERREEGVISALKGDCGYISCAERDSKMFFRLPELLDYTRQPRIADDVEFTIIQDPTSPIRQSAIRIRYLKPGTVQFEIPVSQGLHGTVVREPSTPWVSQEALAGILPSLSNLGLPANVTERLIQSLSSAEVLAQLTGGGSNVPDPQGGGEPGVIQYQSPNGWQSDTIIFHWKDCKNLRNIRVGTKVVFDIHQVRRNRDLVASNIRADEIDDTYSMANLTNNSTSNSGLVHLQQNYRVSPTEQLGGHNHSNISIGNGPQSPPEMLGLPGLPPGSADKKRLTQEDQHAALMTAAALRNGGINYPQSSTAPMNNSNLKSNPMDDYLLPSELGNNNPDRNLEIIHPSSRYDRDSPPLQNGLYSRCSLGGADDSDGGGDPMMRRGSRSPTEGGVTNGGMYSSYGSETPSSSSPSSGCGGGSSSKNPRVVMKGYIAALKDGFGFIETMAQDGEIFFHSSSLVGDFATLEVGQEVEYVVSSKASSSGKNAADIVKPLPKGSIGRAAVFPDILTGLVSRPLRGANPDQTEYTGLIDGSDGLYYPFGIISMLNKKELLQAGEAVEFQLDAQGKPVNIRAIRKKLRAAVEAVKGQYGFLSYELDDGKKLFFHMSEVKDHQHLNPGDEVEFVILQNPRNGKSSACNVVKVGESQRPERLLNRLSKLSVDESAPRLVAIRQPYGPDGTRGFTQPRVPRKVGALSSRESTSSSVSSL